MKVAAAILAAGRSRRLGVPKQLVPFKGRPLLRVLAEELLLAHCDRVSVVVPTSDARIAGALDGLVIEVLSNAARDEGMASSVRIATAWAVNAGSEALFLAVCDQFHLTHTHVDAVIAAMSSGVSMVASRYGDAIGVPALFHERTFPRLLELRGDAGARSVLRAGGDVATVEWPAGALDVDTAEDVRALADASAVAVYGR